MDVSKSKDLARQYLGHSDHNLAQAPALYDIMEQLQQLHNDRLGLLQSYHYQLHTADHPALVCADLSPESLPDLSVLLHHYQSDAAYQWADVVADYLAEGFDPMSPVSNWRERFHLLWIDQAMSTQDTQQLLNLLIDCSIQLSETFAEIHRQFAELSHSE